MYLPDVSVVQSCIHLVQNKERSRAEAERNDTNIGVSNSRGSKPAVCQISGWQRQIDRLLDNEKQVLQNVKV